MIKKIILFKFKDKFYKVIDWTPCCMDESVVSLDAHLAEQAELGNKLFRRLDNIVSWVDRKHISRKIGIEISRNRQKNKLGRR